MESRKELAAEKKRCGSHNCTQSVLCTYCDLTGLDKETIKHAGNCFAAGMGNGEGTCGSIVGAGIVYGLAVRDQAMLKTEDIHPPKTGISVHFSGSLV